MRYLEEVGARGVTLRCTTIMDARDEAIRLAFNGTYDEFREAVDACEREGLCDGWLWKACISGATETHEWCCMGKLAHLNNASCDLKWNVSVEERTEGCDRALENATQNGYVPAINLLVHVLNPDHARRVELIEYAANEGSTESLDAFMRLFGRADVLNVVRDCLDSGDFEPYYEREVEQWLDRQLSESDSQPLRELMAIVDDKVRGHVPDQTYMELCDKARQVYEMLRIRRVASTDEVTQSHGT